MARLRIRRGTTAEAAAATLRQNEIFIDETLGVMYVEINGVNTAVGDGAAGPQGATGAQGAAGSQGTQGSAGAQGTQGTQGAEGAQGPQGTQGVSG